MGINVLLRRKLMTTNIIVPLTSLIILVGIGFLIFKLASVKKKQK